MDSRVYLTTHDICRTFEDCMETLILNRPETAEAVTETMLAVIENKMKLREAGSDNPVTYYVVLAATKKASAAISDHLQDIAAARSAIVLSLDSTSASATLPPGVTVFLTGVRTVKQCHSLEVRYGLPRGVVLIKDTEPLAGSADERAAYIKDVNPVVEFYSAMNCLSTVTDIIEVNSATV